MNVFVDTWGWVAIADENDAYHREVTEIYETSVLSENTNVYTSDKQNGCEGSR